VTAPDICVDFIGGPVDGKRMFLPSGTTAWTVATRSASGEPGTWEEHHYAAGSTLRQPIHGGGSITRAAQFDYVGRVA